MIKKLIQLDTAIYFAVFKPQANRIVKLLMRLLSKSGNGGLYVLLALISALFFDVLGQKFALTVLLAFAIERPLYFVLKKRIARPRPCDQFGLDSLLTPADKFSLPSGHSAGAWLYGVCVTFYIPHLMIPIFLWASGVSISRVVVGVHYPLDILAGGVMGSACALLAIHLMR